MIYFKATDKQVREMMALATNSSQPMGMGLIHFVPGNHFKEDHFELEPKGAFLDYVRGRMVKFRAWRKETPGEWMADTARIDYESWLRQYPGGYEELVKLVGGTLL